MNPESPSLEDVLKLGHLARTAVDIWDWLQHAVRWDSRTPGTRPVPTWGWQSLLALSLPVRSSVRTLAVRTLPGSANVGTAAKMGWLENQAP